MVKHLSLVCLLFWVVACSSVSPPSDPSAAYQPGPGAYDYESMGPVALPFDALDKDLMLRVTYPVAKNNKDSFPVIVFSHGGRCSRDQYEPFARHWASHGYIVVQPAHLDSTSVPRPNLRGMQMMREAVRTRRLDMVHVLDSLDELQRLVPALSGHIDAERAVAAGHSMGGATAMTVTGVVLIEPSDNSEFGFLEDRFDALLLITNPGNSPMMPEDPWKGVGMPTFIATGTDDYSGIGRRISQKKSSRVYGYAESVEIADTPNYYLFIDDMDHYLGGLICKPIEDDQPDPEAARIINGASVAFLDAYIKDDATARAFLERGFVDGEEPRASLTIR